jgi:hypothetical protein
MKYLTVFWLKLVLQGSIFIFYSSSCGATAPTHKTSFENNIVGAWTRPQGEHHEVNLILNADGSAILWPVVGCADKNTAEYGIYKLETKNVSLDDGSKMEMTFLHHNLKYLAGEISPNYFWVNFVEQNKLELIRVDSLVMDLERVNTVLVAPPKNQKKLASCNKN